MNGLSLLFYVSLFAQAPAPFGAATGAGAAGFNPSSTLINPSAANLGSGIPGTGTLGLPSAASTLDDSKSYGWQINQDTNELEYIVQISPSQLELMQSPVDKQEFQSRIPPQLVGRVKRVIITIGNETLPRTPIDEINALLPAIASLPPGKLQDLENGSIVNVNQTGGNGAATQSDASLNGMNRPAPLGSQTQTRTQASPLDDYFSGRGGNANQTSRLSDTTQRQSTTDSGYSSYANGASGAVSPLGQGSVPGQVPDITTPQSANQYGQRLDPSLVGSSTIGTNVNQPSIDFRQGAFAGANAASGGAIPSYSAGIPSGTGYGGESNYGNSSANWRSGSELAGSGQYPSRTRPPVATNGYADDYGPTNNELLYPRRLNASPIDPQSISPALGHLASTNTSPRTDLPGTEFKAPRLDSQQSITSQTIPEASKSRSADSDYFFYIFFILSIAVNMWMVHLLRNLYLRYRNLLSNLRNQATTLG